VVVAVVMVGATAAGAPHDGAWAPWCGAAGCACATVAALIGLTRSSGGLRPLALAGTWVLAFAWPLWDALPAAAAATLATALVVRWGVSGTASRRFDVPLAATLAGLALVLLGAAFGGAPSNDAALAVEPQPNHMRKDGAETRTDAATRDGARTRPTKGARADDGAGTLRGSSARAASPAALVRAYYHALDRRGFARAWSLLSPAVRTSFGGYDRWRAGFATTLTSRPTGIRVRGDAIELTLIARDRAACGVLEQRFAVRWRLDGTRAAAIAATRIGVPTCSPT